jgi:hypothetical protein
MLFTSSSCIVRGTFGIIRGTFGIIQGTFGIIQGTFMTPTNPLISTNDSRRVRIQLHVYDTGTYKVCQLQYCEYLPMRPCCTTTYYAPTTCYALGITCMCLRVF